MTGKTEWENFTDATQSFISELVDSDESDIARIPLEELDSDRIETVEPGVTDGNFGVHSNGRTEINRWSSQIPYPIGFDYKNCFTRNEPSVRDILEEETLTQSGLMEF